jgi:hypothetical protein
MAVTDPSFKPVEVAGLIRVDASGTRRLHVRVAVGVGLASSSVVRARGVGLVTRADGTVEADTPRPSFAETVVALQEKEEPNSIVSEALEQWALPKTPTSLCKVLEIIRDDKGRNWDVMAGRMAPLLGMSKRQAIDEVDRCWRSLQDRAAVGPNARHARLKGRQHSNPMSLHEATGFVRRLLEAWLRDRI